MRKSFINPTTEKNQEKTALIKTYKNRRSTEYMDTQEKENTRKESTPKESIQKENLPQKQTQKNQTDNPHDKGYKRIFSIKKHFLHFIKKYIAFDWMMELEEKDLELIDKEFITDQFDT